MKTSIRILFTFCLILRVAGVMVTTADARASNAVSLSGAWEGVIDDPKRPLVVAADFTAGTAKLDATGSSSWTIQNLSTPTGQVRFQINVGNQSYQFKGDLREKDIRGTVRIGEEVLPFWLERRRYCRLLGTALRRGGRTSTTFSLVFYVTIAASLLTHGRRFGDALRACGDH